MPISMKRLIEPLVKILWLQLHLVSDMDMHHGSDTGDLPTLPIDEAYSSPNHSVNRIQDP